MIVKNGQPAAALNHYQKLTPRGDNGGMVQRLHPNSARRLQKGFNLIESAIVLGVVGLIIGGIWVAAAAVKTNRVTEQTLDGVFQSAKLIQPIMTVNTMKRGLAANGNFWSDVWRVWRVTIEGKIDGFNNWITLSGQQYVVTPIGSMTGNTSRLWLNSYNTPTYLTLILSEVPQAVCKKMAERLKGRISQDPEGSFLRAVSFGNSATGAFQGYFAAKAVASVSGSSIRLDPSYCLTSRTNLMFFFRPQIN